MRKTLSILLYLFAFVTLASGNNKPIFYFSTLTLKDGLSQLSVIQICEDAKGFMWFGTRNGLNKYDGETFTVYRHDNNHPQKSLTDNHITALKADKEKNRLWIGTNEGINRLELTTDQITPYHSVDHPGMAGNEIVCLALDQLGHVWIGSRTGLTYHNPETGTFTTIDLNGLLTDVAITAIYVNARNEIFIGTQTKGFILCDTNSNIIHHFTDTSTPTITDNSISAIFEDSKGTIWIGTSAGGINKWDTKSNIITHYTKDNSQLTDNNIRCFAELNLNLIIGTFNGLSIVNLQNEAITKYDNFDMSEGNLSHFSVYSVCVDRVGTLWVVPGLALQNISTI